MSIKTRFAALALATLAVTGGMASTQAQAKPLHWGVGAGLVGAAIVGTAIAASGPGYHAPGYYYDGYRRCGWVRQFDAFGNVFNGTFVSTTKDGSRIAGVYDGTYTVLPDGKIQFNVTVTWLTGDGRLEGVTGEADVVAPRVGGQWETLHACYGKACLPPIETRLRAGRLKITGFFDDVRVLAIEPDEVARFRAPEVVFLNVNTPDELEAARRLLPALEPAEPR